MQIYKLDNSSRMNLLNEILELMNYRSPLPVENDLLIEYIPLRVTIRIRFNMATFENIPMYPLVTHRVLSVQSEDLHFTAIFSNSNILSPEKVLILLEFLMDPYPNDENKRKLICDVIHDLTNNIDFIDYMSRWIYSTNSIFSILNESKEKQVNGNKYFISVTKMFNEAGEYQLLAKAIQKVLHYDDKDALKIMIENVDPDPIIEWFAEHDVEKLPVVINLFKEYGKYESLEL